MSRSRRYRTGLQVKAEMNVVPYIDVMLVLLVIFMVAAPLIHQQAIEIELPKAREEVLSMPDEADSDVLPLVLAVDEQGAWYLNWAATPNTPVSRKEVMAITAEALGKYPNLPVLVQGDSKVPYAQVVHAIDALREAGAASVGLVTQPVEDAQ